MFVLVHESGLERERKVVINISERGNHPISSTRVKLTYVICFWKQYRIKCNTFFDILEQVPWRFCILTIINKVRTSSQEYIDMYFQIDCILK